MILNKKNMNGFPLEKWFGKRGNKKGVKK